MVPHDANGSERRRRLSRRRFVRAAAASGVLFGASGLSSGQTKEFQLDGVASGWVGRAPSDIADETNPTLTLKADQDYAIAWTNDDGLPHAFVIEDDDGDVVVGPTAQVRESGETQTVEFAAAEEMAEYYCAVHRQSMRGTIDVVGEDAEVAGREESFDARRISVRDLDDRNYEVLYSYRKRRALEVLLSDPEVHDIVEEMIASFEAYDPHTNHLDAISVQGGSDVEIEGGLDEGAFDVAVEDLQVAYGLVDRRTDDLVGLTITDPRSVSWTAWDGDDLGEARLRQVIEHSQVQEYVDGDDWYPLFTAAESTTSARGIEHGGVTPVVLIVDSDDGLLALDVTLDVREDEVGEVIDVNRMRRFVEFPPHELVNRVEPADDTVLEEVPEVPFERRPWYTANDGIHRIERPSESFEESDWSIEWEQSENHGVEIAASYRGTPVFTRLDAPVTYSAYGLPDRDGESTLEWFFPDDTPVFAGELLSWDVHSLDFSGPGALGVIEYPERSDRPEGFRFRTQYYTGARDQTWAIHSGHRFGTSNYDISYDFWEDGIFMPVWRRQGPGFATEYGEPSDEEGDDRIPHHHVSAFAMEVSPGDGSDVEVRVSDGDEWTTPREEFYLVGEPETTVRFTDPEGSETVDLPLEYGTEVVVVRRGSGEVPVRQRLKNLGTESSFYHPAQYIGGEEIQGENVIVWLLMEAATGQVPHPSGITSFVARTEMRLSGY